MLSKSLSGSGDNSAEQDFYGSDDYFRLVLIASNLEKTCSVDYNRNLLGEISDSSCTLDKISSPRLGVLISNFTTVVLIVVGCSHSYVLDLIEALPDNLDGISLAEVR